MFTIETPLSHFGRHCAIVWILDELTAAIEVCEPKCDIETHLVRKNIVVRKIIIKHVRLDQSVCIVTHDDVFNSSIRAQCCKDQESHQRA